MREFNAKMAENDQNMKYCELNEMYVHLQKDHKKLAKALDRTNMVIQKEIDLRNAEKEEYEAYICQLHEKLAEN